MASRMNRLVGTWSLDLRSLALLRVCLGLMILVDLAIRSVDLSEHYSDAGILPRAFQELGHFANHPARFSLHMLSGDATWQALLFAISAGFALLLILGYRTRLSLLASLLLMLSLQNRNAEIETGGDYLLRLICFWCLFLPLGSRFSLDHRAGRGKPGLGGRPGRASFFNAATVALILQMAFVYVFSAVHKSHPIWRVHDSAIHYALHIDAYDTWLGEILREIPLFTTAFTRITLQFEFYGIFALVICGMLSLIPRLEGFWDYQGPIRTLSVLTFISFHLALACSLSLGTFPWFAAIIWLAFFPTWTWDTLGAWHKKMVRRETKRASVKKEQGKVPKHPTHPLVKKLLVVMTKVTDFSTRFETPSKEKKPQPRFLPTALTRPLAWGEQAFIAVAFAYVFLWNLATVEPKTFNPVIRGDVAPLPDARPFIDFTRLDQHWGLFAPYPRTSDGWYVVVGTQKNGDKIDILAPSYELTWKKPDDVSGSYKTFRWRKYFRNIRRRSKQRNLSLYTDYVCSDYNDAHSGDEELKKVTIYFMRRVTRRKGGHEPAKKERLYNRRCSYKTREPGPRRSRQSRSRP